MTKTEIRVDFSKTYQYRFGNNESLCDPYTDMYINLEAYPHVLVDIECALRDILEENNYYSVQYKDVTDARIAIGVESYNRWIFMLREYMCKYHPDMEINWCEHSLNPYEYCKCEIDQRDNIEVDVLKMMCDHHSNRTW